jgi:Arc/MetJ-type ribon-helix-helix transcriptional regulator
MPPPRHPVAAGNADPIPTQTDEATSETASDGEPDQVVVEQPPDKATSSASSRIDPAAAAATSVGEGTASRPATLYLDESLLEFLEEARIAGLVSRPRLDISKSAVVRLALRRLQQDMTIDEIRDHLRAQPTDPTKTGRKRR